MFCSPLYHQAILARCLGVGGSNPPWSVCAGVEFFFNKKGVAAGGWWPCDKTSAYRTCRAGAVGEGGC